MPNGKLALFIHMWYIILRMKTERDMQASGADISKALARLRMIRARGKKEALVVSVGLLKLRKQKVITTHQYNDVMGVTLLPKQEEKNECKKTNQN